MSGEFQEIRDRLREFAAARDWEQFHTPRNLALALCGEAGELAAELQWVSDAEVPGQLRDEAARARIADEAADVLLYLVRFADVCGIDLPTEAYAKIDRNEARFPPSVAGLPPMDHAEAGKFVEQWVTDWNAHNVEAVVSHFADNVVFTSPMAARLSGGEGVIRGKETLRRAWAEGVRRIPDLHFEVLGFYVPVSTLVINYRNQNGGLVCEVLHFEGPVVTEGHGTYLTAP